MDMSLYNDAKQLRLPGCIKLGGTNFYGDQNPDRATFDASCVCVQDPGAVVFGSSKSGSTQVQMLGSDRAKAEYIFALLDQNVQITSARPVGSGICVSLKGGHPGKHVCVLSVARHMLALLRGNPPPALTGHKSNHGYIIFDPESPRFTAKCHDPDCTGAHPKYRSASRFVSKLPRRDRAEAARKKYWSCVEARMIFLNSRRRPWAYYLGVLFWTLPRPIANK